MIDAGRGRPTGRRPAVRAVRARGDLPAARDGRLLGGDARRPRAPSTASASARCTTRKATRAVPLDLLDSEDSLAKCIPGGGGRGPMHQLARLSTVRCSSRGELDGARMLSPQTVEAITARHRVGMFDETFHCECDWGLGFAVDNFAMGRHASPRAFGHGGALVGVRVRGSRARPRRRGADQRHVFERRPLPPSRRRDDRARTSTSASCPRTRRAATSRCPKCSSDGGDADRRSGACDRRSSSRTSRRSPARV